MLEAGQCGSAGTPARRPTGDSAPLGFPNMRPIASQALFPGFMRLWKDPDWNQTLRVAIHWYVESNAQAGAIEGSLVLQQLAIELLAWRVFVEDRGTYTDRDFGNPRLFPAAK